jgi:hypothetical protein
MRTRIASLAFFLSVSLSLSALAMLTGCSKSDESPVPKQPPSGVARLAAQACACQTLDCITPLQTQLAGVIAAQHSTGNAVQENAAATAMVKECVARLTGK